MNQEKVEILANKITEELKRFNITLKYGYGDEITLLSPSNPTITKDGWLIIKDTDNKQEKYINLESVYELISHY